MESEACMTSMRSMTQKYSIMEMLRLKTAIASRLSHALSPSEARRAGADRSKISMRMARAMSETRKLATSNSRGLKTSSNFLL